MQKQNQGAGYVLALGVLAILILMPFHALLTAWLGSNIGYFDLFKLWKEIILVILSFIVVILVVKDKKLRMELRQDRLFWWSGAFIAWLLLMTLVGIARGKVDADAAGYGFIIDARFFVFMCLAFIAARVSLKRKDWTKYILIPAFIVIFFGLLQTVLPNDFLRHFGYGNETLPAFQAVDNKPELARLQSTLRGPNPLGAYLVPILVLFIVQATQRNKGRWLYIACSVAGLGVLFGTYSRSAWVGTVTGVWLLFYLLAKTKFQKRLLYIATSGLLILASILIVLLRNNDYLQNIAFHTNELSSSSTSSNQQRSQALKKGVHDVYRNPLGDGVGSAGPASRRNDRAPARVAENSFIQIAQEAGIVGLVLFLLVLGVIIKRLWAGKPDPISYAVLASLVGLIVINMVSHAWADDTLAYIFFGLVGLTLGGKISTKSENVRYTKT